LDISRAILEHPSYENFMYDTFRDLTKDSQSPKMIRSCMPMMLIPVF